MFIECDGIGAIEVTNMQGDLRVEVIKPDFKFLSDIKIDDILRNVDNQKLFEAIVSNDEDVLQYYLISHGYMFSKN